MLLGGFFAAAGGFGQLFAVAPYANGKLLGVVGAGLAGDLIAQHGAGVLLDYLLQLGLVVFLGGLALGDKGQDEIAGGLHAAVQIQRGDDGLKRIGHHAGAVAAAAQVLAVAQAQVLAQVDLLGKLEQRILTDEAGAHAGQLALGPAGLVEQVVRHHNGQHAVAQKLQALVVGGGDLALVGKASVGQCNAQQRGIFKGIMQYLLQFFRFFCHLSHAFLKTTVR